MACHPGDLKTELLSLDCLHHMHEAGDVCYTDVYQDGTGAVEFVQKEDMTYAVRKLDNTKFRSQEGETAYIGLKLMGPEVQVMDHLDLEAIVVAEATAGVAFTPQGEAKDHHANSPHHSRSRSRT